MDERSKEHLYEQMYIFMEKFSYEYIEGITEEIKEIFFRLQVEGKREIKDFALFFDHETNHYRVAVTLKEYAFPTANRVCLSFLRRVAYTGANITVCKKTEQGIHYALASFTEQERGFYCEVDFLAEEVSIQEEKPQRDGEVSSWIVGEQQVSQRQEPAVQWKFKMDSASYFPLLAAQNCIYSVGDKGDLYAIDAEQGTLRWYWKAEQQHSKITTLPGIDHGVLSVYTLARSSLGTYEATLSALDAWTGRVLWSSPVPALQSVGLCHLLTTQDGIAYLSGMDRNRLSAGPQSLCLALDIQTGIQKWSVDLGTYLGTTTPVVAGGQVYLVTFDALPESLFRGFLHTLDAQTGVEIWHHTFETRGVQEIVADSTDIFVPGTIVEVVDALTGMTKGNLPHVQVFRESPLAVSDELICMSYERLPVRREREAERPYEIRLAGGSMRTGEVLAVDRANKQTRWVTSLTYGHSFPGRPMIVGEVLYTAWKHLDIRGEVVHATLFALDIHTGKENWRFEADDLSAPIVIDGVVFIRGQEDQNDYIYALS